MVIRIEFTSALEMVGLIQVVGEHVLRSLGLDDDVRQRVTLAIRESVINAIRHGNRNDPSRRVFVKFSTRGAASRCVLTIRVRDQGEGFDPASIPDPLAPENLLKSSGRGMLLVRSLMDDVQLGRAPGGGMEVQMIKRIPLTDVSSILP